MSQKKLNEKNIQNPSWLNRRPRKLTIVDCSSKKKNFMLWKQSQKKTDTKFRQIAFSEKKKLIS